MSAYDSSEEDPENMEFSEGEEGKSDQEIDAVPVTDSLKKINKELKKLKKLDNIEKLLKESLVSQNTRINNLELENKKLHIKVEQLERSQQILFKEVRERNLVISGVPDSVNETYEELYNRVCKLIEVITEGHKIEPDTMYRMGKYLPNKPRAVRVKFISIRERETVYSCKTNTTKPIYINEDLPYTVRRDMGLLRKKKRELKENGEESEIDYKTKTLTTDKGEKFSIVDDELISNKFNVKEPENTAKPPPTATKRRNENTSETEKAPRKRAKPAQKSKQNFLGTEKNAASFHRNQQGFEPGHHPKKTAIEPGRSLQ